jgi:hypothetical protein
LPSACAAAADRSRRRAAAGENDELAHHLIPEKPIASTMLGHRDEHDQQRQRGQEGAAIGGPQGGAVVGVDDLNAFSATGDAFAESPVTSGHVLVPGRDEGEDE